MWDPPKYFPMNYEISMFSLSLAEIPLSGNVLNMGPTLGPGPYACLLYTSPSPRDKRQSRMPSSA